MKLPNFKAETLTTAEMMELKGGTQVSLDEGSTTSRRTHTSCSGTDSDSRRTDSD